MVPLDIACDMYVRTYSYHTAHHQQQNEIKNAFRGYLPKLRLQMEGVIIDMRLDNHLIYLRKPCADGDEPAGETLARMIPPPKSTPIATRQTGV